jgi:hypothetical protein
MRTQDYRSVFDISRKELNERFRRRLKELKGELFAKGLPLTYQDDCCPTNDFFIREYEDGTTFLAVFDRDKLEFIPVSQLTDRR